MIICMRRINWKPWPPVRLTLSRTGVLVEGGGIGGGGGMVGIGAGVGGQVGMVGAGVGGVVAMAGAVVIGGVGWEVGMSREGVVGPEGGY